MTFPDILISNKDPYLKFKSLAGRFFTKIDGKDKEVRLTDTAIDMTTIRTGYARFDEETRKINKQYYDITEMPKRPDGYTPFISFLLEDLKTKEKYQFETISLAVFQSFRTIYEYWESLGKPDTIMVDMSSQETIKAGNHSVFVPTWTVISNNVDTVKGEEEPF